MTLWKAPKSLAFALALAGQSACAPWPVVETGRVLAENAPYPVLLTREEMVQMRSLEGDPAAEVLALQARLRSLNARAAALRGPILTAADRRLLEGAMTGQP